VYIFIDRAKAI